MTRGSFGKMLLAGAAAIGFGAGSGGNASAAPITYDFTVTATSGPFAGEIASGSFTYDSASVVPGGENDALGLLTDLSFTFGGVSYTEATLNTGRLLFNPDGSLQAALIGSDCTPQGCNVFAGTPGVLIVGGSLAYATSTAPALGFGTVVYAVATEMVPEPASALLLGAGLLGLAAMRRRAGPEPLGR